MNLRELQKYLEMELSKLTMDYAIETKLILEYFLNLNRADFILNKDKTFEEVDLETVFSALSRRKSREPLQYIIGSQEFMGLPFMVTPAVLIPRQDTETLVEYAIDKLRDIPSPEILDIGTGSGAISVSIAVKVLDAVVTASDISPEALEVAYENAKINGVANRIQCLESDLFEKIMAKTYDMIISNPPYIPEYDRGILEAEVVSHEPNLALFGGDDGLDFYRKIIPEARAFLKPEGFIMFEAGHDQGEIILKMMVAEGYKEVHLIKDLRGIPRFIIGQK